MRVHAALLVIAALAVPSAGHGKGPTIEGFRFCGSSGCRDVTDRGVVRLLLPVTWNGTPRGPAAPGPYYSVRLLDDRRRPVDSHGLGLSTLFYVPGSVRSAPAARSRNGAGSVLTPRTSAERRARYGRFSIRG